jgi:membrane-bound lytic murein transglycosylase A
MKNSKNVMMMYKNTIFKYGVIILVLLFFACGTEKKIRPGLFLLTSDQAKQIKWTDDRNFDDLSISIDQSISYYKRLPKRYRFTYNHLKYSPQEMITSMMIFKNLIENTGKADLAQTIDKQFHVFESRNNDQQAFFTAYYEPVLAGCVQRSSQYPVPLYEMPPDLTRIHLGGFHSRYKGEWITGRVKGKTFVPYESRDEIVYQNALESRAEVIAFVKNHVELFFLQIQGSGKVCFEKDNTCIRVNYAGQNGHPYRAVGRLLKDDIPKEKMSLQAIKEYLYDHPDEIRRILKYNPSYTFFRIVSKGPLGNIEVPLTAWRSIAMDHKLIPKGGLVFYQTTIPEYENSIIKSWLPVQCFALVQDTGGAIRGHGRADIFLGGGEDAEKLAGPMQQTGRILLLVARKEWIEMHRPIID